jgi:DNA polymerase-3 subunit delta
LGEDQARLPGLIDTLVSAYGTSKKLTKQDVSVFLGDAGSVKPWDLTDAIDAGDSPIALEMLSRMVRSGDFHPLQVMAILHTHYVKLMRLDGPEIHSPADVLTLIGGKSEFQGKKYLTQYRRIGSSGISQAVQLLARADVDLRGGKDLGEELTMEILVARLSRLVSSTKSSRTNRAFSPKRN